MDPSMELTKRKKVSAKTRVLATELDNNGFVKILNSPNVCIGSDFIDQSNATNRLFQAIMVKSRKRSLNRIIIFGKYSPILSPLIIKRINNFILCTSVISLWCSKNKT